ncbi:hypothetical protein [Ciceribacter sp. L1K22]|uniref:hypothetical protein n=1 Tax=Ciceribacter sp. L1K22 TaxID=2820275 RepID=UPI001FF01D48|nr:hypothetical protein [Ciceribacter sp. L1K22]
MDRRSVSPLTMVDDTRHTPGGRPSALKTPLLPWLGGAVLWGTAMAISAWLGFALLQNIPVTHHDELMILYFAGGSLTWLTVLPLIRFLSYARPAETRFAAALLLLGAGTVAMTAFIFAMQYRLFYAQWHAPFGSRIWMFQFVFTSAGAVYQFAVLGIRPLLPIGGPILVAMSLLLARRHR